MAKQIHKAQSVQCKTSDGITSSQHPVLTPSHIPNYCCLHLPIGDGVVHTASTSQPVVADLSDAVPFPEGAFARIWGIDRAEYSAKLHKYAPPFDPCITLRDLLEAHIERLIFLLDEVDGDADLEDGHDAEQSICDDEAQAPIGFFPGRAAQ